MGFAPTSPIRTERLLLRPFEPEDFDALFAIYAREDVARYLYWGPREEPEVREMLAERIAHRGIEREGDRLNLAVVLQATGATIGDVVLAWTSAAHAQGEVGFVVHPDHHGHGYATEAVRPLLWVAFERLGLHRVIGRAEARNDASARLMERLGMRREAHLVENEWVKDEWQSELVYAILDREWRAATDDGTG
ncbi:MAG: GNAT family N-acetyltransferase [Planctomycetaceae bacterium]